MRKLEPLVTSLYDAGPHQIPGRAEELFYEQVNQGSLPIIGLCPSVSADPEKPLTGRTGRNLAGHLGVEWPVEYIDVTARINLSRYFVPTKMEEMENTAHRLSLILVGRRVVILGRSVAHLFRLDRPGEELEEDHKRMPCIREQNGVTFIVVPHTSPMNRAYNDPKLKARVRRVLRKELMCIEL